MQGSASQQRQAENGWREGDEEAGDTLEVAQLWGDQLLAVETYPTPSDVTIGGDDSDFTVDESNLRSPEVPIVRWRSGRYALVLTDAMSGVVSDGRRHWSVEEAIERGIARPVGSEGEYELLLGARSSARLRVGSNEFALRFVRMPAGVGADLASIDRESLPYYAVSAAVHLSFLLVALTLPGRAGALEIDDYSALDRFAGVTVQPEEPEEDSSALPEESSSGGEKRHAGPSGKAGSSDSSEEQGRLSVEGPPDRDETTIQEARDERVAMNAGAVKTLRDSKLSSMFSSANRTVGNDAMTAIGNLDEGAPGPAAGSDGLGLAGPGRGGAGDDESRSIGAMPTGESGGDGHPCEPYPACAEAEVGSHSQSGPPAPVPGEPDVDGTLSRKIIRRVVRQHRRELQYCYEKRLQRDRSLEGRVVVEFTISPAGDVISALVDESRSSLQDSRLGQCLTGKVRHWSFPVDDKPGVVEVVYPFDFHQKRE